jgi:hypothetical protein
VRAPVPTFKEVPKWIPKQRFSFFIGTDGFLVLWYLIYSLVLAF